MNVVTNNKWIGQRTIRPDGMDKVTGRAQFAADTTMPGMIWGKVLRSPHPHARIRGIDTSKAEKLPGVKAVVTARDIVDFTVKKGDIAEGFKQADMVIERTFTTRPVHQGYIEPHACLVSVAADGKTTIWSSSQGQFMVRAMTSMLTGIPQSDIRAIPAEIGGGFGGKTIVYLEPLATMLSKKSGRPVKMVMTREEVMRATGPTSGSKSTVKIGATRDGRIVAAHGTFYLQAGAFPGSPIRGAAGCSFTPYDIPNLLSEGYDVVSNRSKVAAYRAPGAPIGAYAVECVLDEVAEALKMDPLDFRLKNAAKEGTKAAHGPVFPRIGYIETVEAARNSDHYKTPLGDGHGNPRGRGVASGFWFNAGGESSAQVNITE